MLGISRPLGQLGFSETMAKESSDVAHKDNFDTKIISEAYLRDNVIKGNLFFALDVFAELKYPEWNHNYLPFEVKAATHSEEARIAALCAVSNIIGKMYRDGTAHFIKDYSQLCDANYDKERTARYFAEAEKYGSKGTDEGLLDNTTHPVHATDSYQLGVMYEQEPNRDLNLAIKAYKQAVIEGNADALCRFGEFFLNGLNENGVQLVEQDIESAKVCFKRSAELQNAKAANYYLKWCAPHPDFENPDISEFNYYLEPIENVSFSKLTEKEKLQKCSGDQYYPLSLASKEEYDAVISINKKTSGFERNMVAVYKSHIAEFYRFAPIAIKGGYLDALDKLVKANSFESDDSYRWSHVNHALWEAAEQIKDSMESLTKECYIKHASEA